MATRIMSAFFCACWLILPGNNAQSWTRRRPRSNKILNQEENDPDPSVYGNFAAMNEFAASTQNDNKKIKSTRMKKDPPGVDDILNLMNQDGLKDMFNEMNALGDNSGNFDELIQGFKSLEGQDMETLIKNGVTFLKDSLQNNPELQALLDNPEQLRASVAPFVQSMGGDMSKFDEVFKNKDALKLSMDEGVEAMEEMASTFLQNLDPSIRSNMDRLLSGDEAVLSELMDNVDVDDLLKNSDFENMFSKFGDMNMEDILATLSEEAPAPSNTQRTQKRGNSKSF